MLLCENFAVKPLQTGEIMSNNKITQLSYFYWNTNEKKADEKAPLFPDETPTVTAILRDASVKMHHGMLFDCRLICIEKVDAKC